MMSHSFSNNAEVNMNVHQFYISVSLARTALFMRTTYSVASVRLTYDSIFLSKRNEFMENRIKGKCTWRRSSATTATSYTIYSSLFMCRPYYVRKIEFHVNTSHVCAILEPYFSFSHLLHQRAFFSISVNWLHTHTRTHLHSVCTKYTNSHAFEFITDKKTNLDLIY